MASRHKAGTSRAARIIAVGGGKGGVGKSVVATNLSVLLAQYKRVALVDADFGAANLHTMLGIDRPIYTLHSFLDGAVESLGDVAIPTQVPGLSLIPGSTAELGAANMPWTRKQKLLRHIRRLDADVVVLDVGAGVAYNALDVFDAADLRVIVMTPQLTSLQNAYSFLKGAIHRTLRRLAKREGKLEALEEARAVAASEPLAVVIDRLRPAHPALAAQMELVLRHYGARIIGNMVFKRKEANAFHAMSRMIHDYVGVAAPVLGYLVANRAVNESVNMRRPLALDATPSENRRTLLEIAQLLVATDVRALRSGRVAAGMTTQRVSLVGDVPPVGEYLQRNSRVAARRPVDWPALVIVDGDEWAAQVKDVTAFGALLSTSLEVSVGQAAELRFPGVIDAVPFLVRHTNPGAGAVGVSFTVSPEYIRSLLDQVDAQQLAQVEAAGGR